MKCKSEIIKITLAAALIWSVCAPAFAQFGSEMVYYGLNKPKRNLLPTVMDDIRVVRMSELMFDALYSGWNDRGEVDPQLAQGMPTLLDDSTRSLIILKTI